MNRQDAIIQELFPTVMVPRFEPLQEIEHGERLLIAEDGLYVESRKSWLHAILKLTMFPLQSQTRSKVPFAELADCLGVRKLPYGTVTEKVEITAPPLDTELRRQIRADAQRWLPDEFAGHVLYEGGRLRYVEAEAESRGSGHIKYRMPEGDVVLDVHSHGRGMAYFSAVDYQDMSGGTYIALVLGRCDREEGFEYKCGLNVCGFFFPDLEQVRRWIKGGS